jgi:uncharacterized membrane protein
MKKYLIAIAMVLALSMNTEVTAQKHRHTPRTEQVDSAQNNQNSIEAFSDTTTVADSTVLDVRSGGSHVRIYSDEDVEGVVKQVFGSIDGKDVAGILTVLGVLFILFILFPIIIIIAVFYFLNRNRRERMKLAQMAMQNGQPIPDELLKEKQASWDQSDYQAGLRQMFTGVGLAIFLGIVIGDIGFGIGALVFCIGLGKWYIARKSGNINNGSQSNNGSWMNNNNEVNNVDNNSNI